MKKFLVMLMLATMILSTGCGDKVEDVKHEAASEIVNEAPTMNTVDEKFSLGGISPGMSFDEAKKILGEPTSQHDDDEFTFANGVMIDVEGGIVEEIKIRQAGVKTSQGVEVGMMEYAIGEFCGAADVIDKDDDGEVDYEYYSGDKKSKIVYTAQNDLIIEIKCSLK